MRGTVKGACAARHTERKRPICSAMLDRPPALVEERWRRAPCRYLLHLHIPAHSSASRPRRVPGTLPIRKPAATLHWPIAGGAARGQWQRGATCIAVWSEMAVTRFIISMRASIPIHLYLYSHLSWLHLCLCSHPCASMYAPTPTHMRTRTLNACTMRRIGPAARAVAIDQTIRGRIGAASKFRPPIR